MNLLTAIVTIVTCLFGSGGIVIWVLNRNARKHDEKDTTQKDLREIKECIMFHHGDVVYDDVSVPKGLSIEEIYYPEQNHIIAGF